MNENKIIRLLIVLSIFVFVSLVIFFNEETKGVESKCRPPAISLLDFPLNNLSYINSSNGLPLNGQWPYGTRVGDVNNDGFLDIIRLRGHDDFNPPDQGFQIWIGDGTGNWTKTAIPNGNFGYGGTAIGDFNNDGFLDAAYGVHHNRNYSLVGAWIGNGGTNFTESSTGLGMDGETYGMAPIDFGDYNNDGFLDIGVGSFGAGNGIRAYMNLDGGIQWQSQSDGLPHTDNFGDLLFWADINRDGFLDIIGCSDYGLVWLGDGTGNWTGNDFGLPNKWDWNRGIDMGDINNDGWLDMAYIEHINSGNNDWYVPVVYIFDGTGWTNASDGLPIPSTYPDVSFDPLAFGDLNNDGNLDLIALEGYTTGSWPSYYDWTSIHLWIGDGQGNWSELNEIETGIPGWPQSVTLADIDHNNYLDIVISSDRGDYEPGGIRVYKNAFNPSYLNVTIRQPLGGDVFCGNALRKIAWTSAVPNGNSSVSLYYSITGPQGPWISIKENITDNNYYQWTVPLANTTNGYIKITVYGNNQTCMGINPLPFSIIEGQDVLPPSIQNVTVNPPVQEVNKTVNITCMVNDNVAVVDTYIIITYPDENTVNETMLNIDNIFYWNFSYALIGNYYFYIWAIDINGNSASSSFYQFEIIHLQAITVNESLYQGWNLVTVPLDTVWTAEKLGKNISGCTVVCRFDASSQSYVTHAVGIPYNDFPILDGVGYFVYVTSDSYLNVTGLPITLVNVSLSMYWNLIGWCRGTATTASVLGAALQNCTIVCMYDAAVGSYVTHVVGIPYNDFVIARGMGLFIYATKESAWHGEG